MNQDTMERIVPDKVASEETTGGETLRLHIERYRFAANHAHPGLILDIACGAGYGTVLLAQSDKAQNSHVVGVDISSEAIAYAKERYASKNVEYITDDANFFDDGRKYDSIVSLETIEHVDEPEKFIKHLAGLLSPHGHFIASVPVTPSVDANPHHKTDFTPRSFRQIFKNLKFQEKKSFLQIQPFSPFRVLRRQEARMKQMRPSVFRYYLSHPASFLKRLYATVRYGFNNRYLTIVWERED